MNLRQRFYAIHVFLAQHMFYALALSTLLACVILAARVARVHHWTYVFLVWNLLLAWAPYLGSLWAAAIQQRYPRAWWRLLLPGALWLLFFPNAPYLVTDLIHLRERLPVPLWYDVGLLASFALSGCFLAVASLHTMQTIVRRIAGGAVSWLFVLGAVGLSGLGVYLGRVERWNSWDVLLSPRAVLSDAIRPILAPASHIHPIGIICMFAALLFICYVMFVATRLGGRTAAASSRDDAPLG